MVLRSANYDEKDAQSAYVTKSASLSSVFDKNCASRTKSLSTLLQNGFDEVEKGDPTGLRAQYASIDVVPTAISSEQLCCGKRPDQSNFKSPLRCGSA